MVMKSIKPLPEAIRSSVRSGIVVSDLTKIVEELIFNSLDAGASKVSVFLGVQSCYVKVVDDGSGISRDGLVLVGERYASSKLRQLTDLDAASQNFGFRGEALASISNFSILEIITKAHGKPNGYRKVIKECKCLYLGIDDERKKAGTTVVLRDLFFNQPVRRKLMQSSSNKALNLVKKSVFQVALVHPNVSFKVVDIESEEEYLNTRPSSSPLALLMSGFGINESSSLHQLNASDGLLKLSGYISGPSDNLAFKAFQYVYINSRIVCKCLIHKLLNNMTSSLEYSDPWKVDIISQKGKRNRPQEYPAYILNIFCPPTFYDLTFEPSKTYVEFKDWKTILSFINKAIQSVWRKVRSYELVSPDAYRVGTLGRDESWKEDGRIDSVEDHSFEPWDDCTSSDASKIHRDTWASDINVLPADDHFLDNTFSCSGRSITHLMGNRSDSKFSDNYLAVEDVLIDRPEVDAYSIDHHDVSNELLFRNSSFLRGCSSRTQPPDEPSVGGRKIQSPTVGLKNKRKRFSVMSDSAKVGIDQSVGFFSWTTMGDDASPLQTNWKLKKKDKIPRGLDVLAEASVKALTSHLDNYGENGFLADSTSLVENSGLGHPSSDTKWYSVSSDPFFQSTCWNVGHFSINNSLKEILSREKAVCQNFADEEKDFPFNFDLTSQSYTQEDFTFDSTTTLLGHKDDDDYSKDFCGFRKCNFDDNSRCEYSGILVQEREYLRSDSQNQCNENIDTNKVQKHICEEEDDKFRHVLKERLRRSRSAPPFCKEKERGISLNGLMFKTAVGLDLDKIDDAFTSSETVELNHHQQSPKLHHPFIRSNDDRQNINHEPDFLWNKKIGSFGVFKIPQWLEAGETASIEEHIPKDNQDLEGSLTKNKWWNGYALEEHKSCDIHTQDDILDISLGFLHHASNLLIPVAMNKDSLQEAKVLQQVDKKFIPIVAGGTLALIDQHAADERIQLEELRAKILSGDAKTVSYLDAEQELNLPEIGYQLLQNYAEHVKEWGWICSIHTKGLRSFKKSLNILHRQQTSVTLLAVPCILGVSLSDKDLLEFLQQLSETDGSSTMPPAVLRVLNNKACRGAIMFGDSLLHSECSLIFEELKKTSLCFQCAHGRPTMVPIVKLKALHKQITKLEASGDRSKGTWHGLHRHSPSLERATLRLAAARG